ncbi:4-amino-4-deoxychorismate lyase [Caldalkalibacillus uzonensis]|uniref:4-amino-4-deoxychorismate lyase n=1 Tax=Caldalkalibacillus uzonensis TaxID=353224 RepID=A0ABU0CXK5_9BACI|nr:aminodeoxychorismate lyase [Caldalkalibacillus uzonensis]MDQ0340665.1 4-amino-4-deoxychorismate lyase [Caldalkalibacillus uzonensis]
MFLILNGEVVAHEQATISVYDHGFLYGAGLFETFRTYKGHPFLLDDHLARLEKGCREIGLPWQADRERVVWQIEQLLKANNLEDGRFRLNVSAGAAPVGLPSTPYDKVTEILFVSPVSPAPDYKILRTVSVRRNEPEGDERWKSHHFLNNLLAQREVPAGAEGVMLTKSGKVAEGVVSNLFFVKQGKLYTPALSTGILNGITRQWVLAMSAILGIPVEEGEYDLAFAQEADEVFITNSVQELVAVTQWDERSYPCPCSHLVTQRLRDCYNRYKTKLWSIDEIGAYSIDKGEHR